MCTIERQVLASPDIANLIANCLKLTGAGRTRGTIGQTPDLSIEPIYKSQGISLLDFSFPSFFTNKLLKLIAEHSLLFSPSGTITFVFESNS